jgi:hypothetical protein
VQIPEDWLVGRRSMAEVEEELSREDAPVLWLEAWWALLDRMEPGDELWDYAAEECQDPGDPVVERHVGFVVMRGGRVVDAIEMPWLSGPSPM